MRLFFALMPSDGVVQAVQPLQSGVSGARWQTAQQLHVTLRFMGEVSGRIAEELADMLPLLATDLPLLAFSGVGFFEAKGHPNALWARVTPKEPLAQLHRKLDRACQSVGLEPERRAYIPHLTLARLGRSAGPIRAWVENHAGFATPPLHFPRISLVESVMTDEGSHYEELAGVGLPRP